MRIKHPSLDGVILTKHHIRCKMRGGILSPDNTLKLWSHRHLAWHKLFRQCTIWEVCHNIQLYVYAKTTPEWKLLFKNKSFEQISKVLHRLMTMKTQLANRKRQ